MQRLRERVAELEGKEQATEASAKEWADKVNSCFLGESKFGLLTHRMSRKTLY